MKNQKTGGEDQREVLIQYWIEKATESLQSARSEYESRRLAFAMNRIYYSAFYALTGFSLSRGEAFKKHKGLRSALHRDLVRNGILDIRWGKFFDDIFECRQRGDYTPMITFEPEQVEDFLHQAGLFLDEIIKLIKR